MSEIPEDQVVYPCECHFRIIAFNRPGMFSAIEQVLKRLHVTGPLEESHVSNEGTYKSFAVSTVVWSRDEMNAIDRTLRDVEGVKMVL